MNLNTEQVTIFKYDDWLSKTMGNRKKLSCELGAEVDGKKLVNGKRKYFNLIKYGSMVEWLRAFSLGSKGPELPFTLEMRKEQACLLYTSPSPRDS